MRARGSPSRDPHGGNRPGPSGYVLARSPPSDPSLVPHPVAWPARQLRPAQRHELALQVLAGTPPGAELARPHRVSREVLYRQADAAQHALSDAPEPEPSDREVLFDLPVTEARSWRLIPARVSVCHSPYRAVVEVLRDLRDWEVSLGAVSHIVHGAVEPARAISRTYHLAGVRIGAPDEIFQAGHPVLVGGDTASTYRYPLSPEDHRDAEAWGGRPPESVDRGFDPEATVAEAGRGLRAGQAPARPGVPCRGDLCPILRDPEQVVSYLEDRAYGALEGTERRRRRPDSARGRDGRGRAQSVPSAARRLRGARAAGDAAVAPSAEVAPSIGWLGYDGLAVAGPRYADRGALSDSVVAGLKARAPRCPHRLEPVCRQSEGRRDDLLAFAQVLAAEWERSGQEFRVPAEWLRRPLGVLARDERDPRRWTEGTALRARRRGRSYDVRAAVGAVAAGTVRAGSLVEDLNSRLRGSFFLRRHRGADELAPLQVVLNHRRPGRSDRRERVGEAPAEPLTGPSHPHGLERLGSARFAGA